MVTLHLPLKCINATALNIIADTEQSAASEPTKAALQRNTDGNTIGIKHGFLCINIKFCQVPREVLKTEVEDRGF